MTDGVSVELKGYNRVANKFRHLASKSADIIDDDIGDFTRKQRKHLKSKPSPQRRPGQRYIRTGELANRWKATKRANGQWAITNDRKGVKYVVGRDSQAWMHKNRWWIFEDEMEAKTPELTKQLTKTLIDEWDGAG